MKEPKDIKILVVEDEPSLRKAIVFDFQRKGFDVKEAENGKQAFEFIKTNPVDVVLTDVRMPGGDGIELLDNVKSLNPALPVVMFITGFADISIEDAYDKGVDAVFAKPFDRKALMGAVLKAVSTKEEQWGAVQLDPTDVEFNIELNFPEYKQITEGRLVSLGRGGMFVSLSDTFPAIDAKTHFKINFKTGKITSLQGSGVVRWIRAHKEADFPAGCGIEFNYLNDENRQEIIDFIRVLKTKAFIPKG